MAVNFSTHEIKYNLKDKRKIVNWIKEVVYLHGKKVGTISIVFTNDEYILETNRQFLNHNYFTDIITFDYTEKNVIEGDILISLDTVRSNALKYNTTFENELLRVIIHGVLHLLGFKDKSSPQQKVMRSNENQSLEIYFSKYE